MDFPYLVKQLNHEIEIGESQLREKKSARDKLLKLLSPQEKALLEAQPEPPPNKPPGS
jgi:hypothetical protein